MNEHGHRAYALAPLAGGLPARRVECPMCRQAGGGAAACESCGAPLTPPPRLDEPVEAHAGRRHSPRVERQDQALWHPAGGGAPMNVRVLDLSFTGMHLASHLPVSAAQVARIRAPNIDAVVEVVGCRREGSAWSVHARTLTMRLLRRAGAFVSARA